MREGSLGIWMKEAREGSMQKVAFELNPKDGQDSLNGNGRGLSGKREGLSKEGGKKH